MADKRSKKRLIALPKLFPRGRAGILYFRLRIEGKDTWISTDTSDPKEAAKLAGDVIRSRLSLEVVSRTELSAHKLADSFVKGVVTARLRSRRLDACHEIWKDAKANYGDLSECMRSFYDTIFERFVGWAAEQEVEHAEDVTYDLAKKYAKLLWESGVTPKTYNDYLKHLSAVFAAVNASEPLPHGNPFAISIVARKKKSDADEVPHEALEPEALKAVLLESARHGVDYRDLFVIGSQTGMRLKCAALLKWESIKNNFIEIKPYKTQRSGNTAKIPVTGTLQAVLDGRGNSYSEYVIPSIAASYLKDSDSVIKKSKRIFERALGGKAATVVEAGRHRKRCTSIFSYHSFRVTFMSLLAQKDVSTRDAMRIMGWESPDMIQVYERELEKARGDADARTTQIVNGIDELKFDLPAVVKPKKKLVPTKEALERLMGSYSNVAIGQVYGFSEAAVRKWLDKYGITRARRIESPELPEDVIEKIRAELKEEGA